MTGIESIACDKNQVSLGGIHKAPLYDVPAMSMGRRISQARKRLTPKPSLAAVGDALGISGQAVSDWELDKSQPEARRLPALADFLKVPIRWLLEDTNEPPPAPDSLETEIETLTPSQRAEIMRHIRLMREDHARETAARQKAS